MDVLRAERRASREPPPEVLQRHAHAVATLEQQAAAARSELASLRATADQVGACICSFKSSANKWARKGGRLGDSPCLCSEAFRGLHMSVRGLCRLCCALLWQPPAACWGQGAARQQRPPHAEGCHVQVAEAKDAELARVLDSNAGLREEVATLRAMQVLQAPADCGSGVPALCIWRPRAARVAWRGPRQAGIMAPACMPAGY